jgi:hypothetical protein
VIIFWIAAVCGVLVAVVYLTLGVRAFVLVRRDVLAAAARGIPDDIAEVPDETHRGFVWKALGGVCASTLVIVLLGVNSLFWYLPIALAIGSAIAVIIAFLIDGRSPTPQPHS